MTGMQTPGFDIFGFLGEPGHPASVATVTAGGHPALAMMWFAVEDDRLWFHSPQAGPAPFLRAAAEGAEVAVMVATFSPPDDVRQVRMTGPARLENRDEERVRRIYGRYVPAWSPAWDRQATSASYQLWTMSPQRGMAVTYPGLADRPVFTWSELAGLLAARA
jgi:Pyridoxamine 5'-phosphate oxidase